MEINRLTPEPEGRRLTPREELALGILTEVRDAARSRECKVMGQLVVEVEGQPPLPLVLMAKSDGAYLMWFVDGPVFRLSCLVNENLKRIAEIPVEEQEQFEALLGEIQQELGE